MQVNHPVSSTPKTSIGGLARKLIQLGLIQEEGAILAAEEATKYTKPFVSCLIENNLIDPMLLAITCAHEFGLPVFDLSTFELKEIPQTLINPRIVSKYHALPLFRRGNRLFVAISDPTNLVAL